MGHSSTEMLFRVYSRYVPDLTRQDGSAMENLLLASKEKLINSTAGIGANLSQGDSKMDTRTIYDDSHTDLITYETELEDQDRGVAEPTQGYSFNPFGHRINLHGDLIEDDLNGKETHHENN